jgi:hypothetical protein
VRTITNMKIFFALLSVSLSSEAAVFKDYTVNDISVRLSEYTVIEARSKLAKVIKALGECAATSISIENKMLARTTTYQITPSGNACRLDLELNETWHFSCLLSKDESLRLSSSMRGRLKNASVFGDLVKGEKDIIFDKDKCDTYNLL